MSVARWNQVEQQLKLSHDKISLAVQGQIEFFLECVPQWSSDLHRESILEDRMLIYMHKFASTQTIIKNKNQIWVAKNRILTRWQFLVVNFIMCVFNKKNIFKIWKD